VQDDIRSDQVSGLFKFGLRNNLPHGVDVLTGNDFYHDNIEVCV